MQNSHPSGGWLLERLADWLGVFWSAVGAVAGIAAVIVTVLIYVWTRATRPHWQLNRSVFYSKIGPTRFVELWVENVGGSTAGAAYVDHRRPNGQVFRYPFDGRLTVPVGGHLTIRADLYELESISAAAFGKPHYLQGDDRVWDLRGHIATVHWGPGGKYMQVIRDLHSQQSNAPAVDARTYGWDGTNTVP